MARAAITVNQIAAGPDLNKAITWTNGDAAEDHTMANDGRTLLIVNNTSGGAAIVQVVSVADPRTGRSGDIGDGSATVSIANGEVRIFGPFPPELFNQAGNVINVNTDTGGATCRFAGVRLP